MLLAAALPSPLFAQAAGPADAPWLRDEGGHPFRTPAGSPLEGVHRIAFFTASGTEAAGGAPRGGLASADVGDRIPFWIRRGGPGRTDLAGAVHMGVFSRFDLDGPDQALVETHYRLGFQLRARLGSWAARAEMYHVSSHLGDEYLVATGAAPISTSRDGIEVLVQRAPLPGLAIHAGPGLLLRSASDLRPWSLRAGTAWLTPGAARTRLYASVDAFAWSEAEWRPRIAAEVGAAFGSRLRLGVLLGWGATRLEQFPGDSERLAGVSASYLR